MNITNLKVEIGTHVELELIGQSGERERLNLTLMVTVPKLVNGG